MGRHSQRNRATRRWAAVLLTCPLVLFGTAPPTSARGGTPDNVGLWTEPFAESVVCPPTAEGKEQGDRCKPVAKMAAVLPDGRVVYVDGAEGQRPAPQRESAAPEDGSPTPEDGAAVPAEGVGHSRVLDLRSGTPEFVVPPTSREGAESDPGGGVLQCADLVALADGRILAVGGNSSSGPTTPLGTPGLSAGGTFDPEGSRMSRMFDWRTNSWQVAGALNHARWYGAAVTLADGKVLAAGGLSRVVNGAESSQLRVTETYDPATDTWTENHVGPQSESTLPLQPRLFLTPNNKVFYNAAGQMWGPFGQSADQALYSFQQFFDPVTKTWEMVSRPNRGARSGATQVPLMLDPPYDQMTILSFGGTMGSSPGSGVAVATSELTTVDKNGNLANTATADLDRARTHASGVLLPDGTVLAVGGSDTDDVLAPGSSVAVHSAEQYNPFKREWIEVADHIRDRRYHSTAVLLPDMRVLLGGHSPSAGESVAGAGGVFSSQEPDPSFEIYSPRYLFRGARPVITGLQAGIAYKERFRIRTEEPDSIAGVVMMRIGSPQHFIDNDQRSLRLEFSRVGSNTLEVIAPPNGVAAPPGYYYLVIIKQNLRGAVPSVARIVRMGDTSDHREAVQPFPDDSSAVAVGQAEPAEDHSRAAGARRFAGETVGDLKYGIPEDPYPVSGPSGPGPDGHGFLSWPGRRLAAF